MRSFSYATGWTTAIATEVAVPVLLSASRVTLAISIRFSSIGSTRRDVVLSRTDMRDDGEISMRQTHFSCTMNTFASDVASLPIAETTQPRGTIV